VELKYGCIRGVKEDNIFKFKGIPYAAPIDGHTRFLPPQPPHAWEGVRNASQYGPTAITSGLSLFNNHFQDIPIEGNEFLNLNIWTPSLSKNTKDRYPVFFWIHGGGFTQGSGSMSLFDCANFAKKGIVGITINYRLGIEGFMAVKDEICNRGLLDQIYALEWVKNNIELFGGDPNQVTIAGESAGSMCVATLLCMPRAKGLFKRAILQSGGAHKTLLLPTAEKVTKYFEQATGLSPTRTALENIPRSQLNEYLTQTQKLIRESPDHNEWMDIQKKKTLFNPR